MILGLLPMYFIGKAFYELAHEYNKNRWGFAILGVVSYYVGILLAGFFFGLLAAFGVADFFLDMSDLTAGLIAFPIGLLTCWGLYRILKNNWSNQAGDNKNDALDSDFINPQQ